MIWLISASIGCCSLILLRLLLQKRISLRGKTILITGASSGLGEALARRLFEYECTLVLIARRIDRLQTLSDELIRKHPTYPKPKLIELDLSNIEQIPLSISLRNVLLMNPIDCLINNAGLSQRSSVLSTPMDIVQDIFRVNYLSVVQLTQLVLKQMIDLQRSNASIVNISSMQGLIAVPDRSSYSASKHAVQAFSDSLRMELKEEHEKLNINVCVVSPSYIRTELGQQALNRLNQIGQSEQKNSSAAYEPDDVAQRIIRAIEYRQTEVIIAPFVQHIAIWLRRYFPSFYYRLMVARNKRLKAQN